MRYVFRDDRPVTISNAKKANPQVIGEALEKITATADGKLTPHAVVEAARNQRHPLHKFFEWDDAVAAEAYRVDQAREIIRIVRVEDADAEDGNVRAFLSISDRSGTSYRRVGDVKSSVELQAIILRQAERDLEAFERRYRELKDVCDVVRTARESIAAKRTASDESRPSA